jgi:hemolysin activation/secretion protein
MLVAGNTIRGIPGSADVSRIEPDEKIVKEHILHDGWEKQATNVLPSLPMPENAKDIHFVLKGVKIEGMTVFADEQVADLYASDLNQNITLEKVYQMAEALTKRYRDADYFLSLVHVPDQNIKEGWIVLRAVEGHIDTVDVSGDMADNRVVKHYIQHLTAKKPVRSKEVESFLLHLNDLPGLAFRAVLTPLENGPSGATKLTLRDERKAGRGSITVDNFSSRFLGPQEASAFYSKSLIPLHHTSVSGFGSLPMDKMRYGALHHAAVIAPRLKVEMNGSRTKAFPGYTLGQLDIKSFATAKSIGLHYQWVRQRHQNLLLKFTLETRDVVANILGAPLTRDHIRVLATALSYDKSDAWQGYNTAVIHWHQGIKALGASKKGDANLSRAGAVPDFTKFRGSLSRTQRITDDWSLMGSANGQWTPDTLYSYEQFSYGGQSFGRAYDSSAFTADKGVEGSLELRYAGFKLWGPLRESLILQSYAFYDIGELWNNSAGQQRQQSAASAGFGLRFSTLWRQMGNIGLAWPLTRDIETPIYGGSRRGPRFMVQFTQEF